MIEILGTALDYTLLFVRGWWPIIAIVAFAMAALPLPEAATRIGAALETFASKPWRGALSVGALCLAWSAGMTAIGGSIPVPRMHDDLACSLGAQMFANGRASYPTHPLWPHFEQFHVLHVPSYAPKYPMGNQLLMAAGLRWTGVELAGSWIAAAAACMAIFWALSAVLPARWALAGAAAAAIHPVMLCWSRTYRGGGLAALGGALLFGATLRMAVAPTARLGAIAGAGLAMLAMSRPYEGLVLAFGCAISLLVHRGRGLVVPAATCVGVALVAGLIPMALHNRAVTGSVTTLPWAEYARQYDPAPQFIWQRPGAMPHYRNEEFRFVYERLYRTKFDRVTAPGGLLPELDRKAYWIRWMLAGDPETRLPVILWPLFLIPFVMLPRALRRDRGARIAAIVILVFAFAPFSMFVNLLTHYLAPVAAAVAVLMVSLVRELTANPRGKWIAVAIAAAILANAAGIVRWDLGGPDDRTPLVAAAGPGQHLMLVAPDVIGVVYNGPQIDAQAVVWARDLGDNAALLAYYRDRNVWRVVKDGPALRLVRQSPVPEQPAR